MFKSKPKNPYWSNHYRMVPCETKRGQNWVGCLLYWCLLFSDDLVWLPIVFSTNSTAAAVLKINKEDKRKNLVTVMEYIGTQWPISGEISGVWYSV